MLIDKDEHLITQSVTINGIFQNQLRALSRAILNFLIFDVENNSYFQ